MTLVTPVTLAPKTTSPSDSSPDFNPSMDSLIEEITSYLAKHNSTLLQLAEDGQKPEWTIVSCIDSRYAGVALGNKPGKRINIANIANIIPPYDDSGIGVHGVSAALQFSVKTLKVQGILILGHSGCGGIQALLENNPSQEDEPDFITSWMRIVAPAREKILAKYGHLLKEEQATLCEQEALKISYANALNFPFIREAIEKNTLSIYAAHFNPTIGLRILNPENMEFELAIKSPPLES